uniref:Uncharacterized protein n=1 Tax=Candidatus Kentrum sp. UNK TaxID=2126344 RepID=A0A451AYB8_9GAMM|nr:MAG: hypothetical protein BECKUNK1418G_GA0071005_104323 [Candidatus Kentron sp. UNK]VFK71021.1 MAG: hypothetical protein BECKUNK1418H_GA0071006_104723 [Candidatus Kentron sp. UNK]
MPGPSARDGKKTGIAGTWLLRDGNRIWLRPSPRYAVGLRRFAPNPTYPVFIRVRDFQTRAYPAGYSPAAEWEGPPREPIVARTATDNSDTATGVTPGIRAACPRVAGRTSASRWRTSVESPGTLA